MLQESENKSSEAEEKKPGSYTLDGRYQTLFEQVNAAVFLTTLDGKILEANLKSCELLGYIWDDLLQLSLREVLPASTDWPQLIDEISSKGGISFETENIRKDGSHVPVEISTSLFTMDGKPVMLALVQDITERKNAEKKLKEIESEKERIKIAYENARFIPILTDELKYDIIKYQNQEKPRMMPSARLIQGREGMSLSRQRINQIVSECAERAEIKSPNPKRSNVHPHMFRHTFVRYCQKNGINPKIIQKMLGHSSIKTTLDMYGEPSFDDMVEELHKMSNFAGKELY